MAIPKIPVKADDIALKYAKLGRTIYRNKKSAEKGGGAAK
jgi:hypothetical protein